MAIERQSGKLFVLCDGYRCDEFIGTRDNGNDALLSQLIRENGWRAVITTRWRHFCPACWQERTSG
jgi:hypothetical protein